MLWAQKFEKLCYQRGIRRQYNHHRYQLAAEYGCRYRRDFSCPAIMKASSAISLSRKARLPAAATSAATASFLRIRLSAYRTQRHQCFWLGQHFQNHHGRNRRNAGIPLLRDVCQEFCRNDRDDYCASAIPRIVVNGGTLAVQPIIGENDEDPSFFLCLLRRLAPRSTMLR